MQFDFHGTGRHGRGASDTPVSLCVRIDHDTKTAKHIEIGLAPEFVQESLGWEPGYYIQAGTEPTGKYLGLTVGTKKDGYKLSSMRKNGRLYVRIGGHYANKLTVDLPTESTEIPHSIQDDNLVLDLSGFDS